MACLREQRYDMHEHLCCVRTVPRYSINILEDPEGSWLLAGGTLEIALLGCSLVFHTHATQAAC